MLASAVEAPILPPVSPKIELYAGLLDANDKVSVISKKSYQELIKELWGSKANIALAVLKAENGTLNPKAKGYNCRYGNRTTFCQPEDRHNAVSIDCGLWQVNQYTAPCDAKAWDPIESTLRAKKIYDERKKRTGDGFEAWYAYKNNLHLKFL